LPDQGVPTGPRLKYVHRKKAELKQWLDRNYGRQGRPVWADELGERTRHLHSHTLIGDYGYVDFPKARRWMVANGLCDRTQDGRLVPWHFQYELLKHPAQGVRYVAKYLAKTANTVWPSHARTRYVPIAEPRWKGECGPHKRVAYSRSWFNDTESRKLIERAEPRKPWCVCLHPSRCICGAADDWWDARAARLCSESLVPGDHKRGELQLVFDRMDARVTGPARTRQGARIAVFRASHIANSYGLGCWDCLRLLLSAVDPLTMFTYNRNHHGPPEMGGGGAVK
jgi:hypothetical protein